MEPTREASDKAKKIVRNHEHAALAMDILGASELGDAERMVLDYIASLEADRDRIDQLAAAASEYDGACVTIEFTEAWQETGDFGSVLSWGPREFWLNDDGESCGPDLRSAIDAWTAVRARAAAVPSQEPSA